MNQANLKALKNTKSIKKEKGIILDTKPLVLFIVGSLFPDKITRFNRTKEFSHLTLEENGLSREEKNEIANFIKSIKINDQITEILSPMTNIFSNKHIAIIGAGDASLLEIDIDNNIPILTSDGVLADIARNQSKKAIKFLPFYGLVEY